MVGGLQERSIQGYVISALRHVCRPPAELGCTTKERKFGASVGALSRLVNRNLASRPRLGREHLHGGSRAVNETVGVLPHAASTASAARSRTRGRLYACNALL